MNLKIGIVGLPNVGKSTLFNALTRTACAATANYPFCTIDPNVGVVTVPDHRLQELAKLVNPARIVPAVVEFVDIAGLVKGASQGEGLGNKFLANIRECQAIAQVVRVFEDTNIIHVHNRVNPKEDKEIIEAELILADLQTLDKRLDKTRSEAKSGAKDKILQVKILEKLKITLESGKKAGECFLEDKEKEAIADLFLLTMKPILYIANVKEEQLKNINIDEIKKTMELKESDQLIPICAKIEEELAGFSEEEAKNFLQELGLKESGLNSLIKSAYKTLGLENYFTAGPKEVRAWIIKKDSLAPQAAGAIHTDFEKGFIRAEVIAYDDYIKSGGEKTAKEKGLMRVEGKEYVVQDGDIMVFRFAN